MTKKFIPTFSIALVICLFILAAVPSFAAELMPQLPDTALIDDPEVVLEALDQNNNYVPGTIVTVKEISDSKNIVFKGITDKKGQIKFKSVASSDFLARTPSTSTDLVYEVFFVSPEGELTQEYFAVPHIKDPAKASKEDLINLEKQRKKKISTKFNNKDIPHKPKDKKDVEVLTIGYCDILGGGYKSCITDEKDYSQDTQIGVVNLASGETAKFNFTSASKVSINIGYKKDSAAWILNGNVSLSNDVSTGIDYTINGTCSYFGSTLYCNLGRKLYAKYLYHYEQRKIYYYNALAWTENVVVPIAVGGSSAKVEWFTDGNNGKSISSITPLFQITSFGSTTKSYKSEKSFGVAFSVPTPLGAFSGGVTTQYTTSHSINWSTTTTNTYTHYDNGTNQANFYVTQ